MKILEKYIFTDFIKTYLYCLSIFISMFIVMDILGHIEEIVKEKVAAFDLMLYYANFMPFIFVNTSPIAILLATMFVLGNLNRTSEITAMKASGVSLLKILKPLLAFGLVMSFAVFMVNEKIATNTNMISSQIKEEKIRKKEFNKVPKKIHNVALYGSGNVIVFAKLFETSANTLKDVIVHEHDNNQNLLSKRIIAKAQWQNGKWVGKDVTYYKIDDGGFFKGLPQYRASENLPVREEPEEFTKIQRQTEFMNYRQLKNYISRFAGAKGNFMNQLRVDLHHKLSFPLLNLIIILTGAPFALYSHRGGALIGFGFSVIISLIYYTSMSILMAFGKAGLLPPVLSVWLAHVFFLSTGIYFLRKRG